MGHQREGRRRRGSDVGRVTALVTDQLIIQVIIVGDRLEIALRVCPCCVACVSLRGVGHSLGAICVT
jgi:hypothetical protein